jgi:hypothetical protein
VVTWDVYGAKVVVWSAFASLFAGGEGEIRSHVSSRDVQERERESMVKTPGLID